jgi:uncharacterized protein YcfJ
MSLFPLSLHTRAAFPPQPQTSNPSSPSADPNNPNTSGVGSPDFSWANPNDTLSSSQRQIPLPPQLKTQDAPALDPITRKELNLAPDAHDKLLNLNNWQKTKLNIHNTFVDMPKQIYHGLRGDDDFTGTHLLNIAAIPYYLGGGFLAASFAAGGGNKLNVARQASGVLLYYAGTGAANAAINALAKQSSGVDLGVRYQSPDGDIHKAFNSVNFSRYDLWKDSDYARIAKKMNIPDTVADPRQEVRQRTRRVVSETDTDKLILGNILAAIGAGFIAHRIPWARLMPGNIGSDLKQIWRGGAQGQANESIATRLKETGHLTAKIGLILMKFIVFGHREESDPRLRKIVLTTMAGLTGLIAWRTVRSSEGKDRHYKPAQLDRMSPSLQDPNSPVGKQAVFNRFQDNDMQSLLEQQGGTIL